VKTTSTKKRRVQMDATNWNWSPCVRRAKDFADYFPMHTHWSYLPAYLSVPADEDQSFQAIMPQFAFGLLHDPAGNPLIPPENYTELLRMPELPTNLPAAELNKRKISLLFEHRVLGYHHGWERFEHD